jgi:maltose-binding protein MalE
MLTQLPNHKKQIALSMAEMFEHNKIHIVVANRTMRVLTNETYVRDWTYNLIDWGYVPNHKKYLTLAMAYNEQFLNKMRERFLADAESIGYKRTLNELSQLQIIQLF